MNAMPLSRSLSLRYRRDPDEAQHLIDATLAYQAGGDTGLRLWLRTAEGPREREFRRRAGLAVLATAAEHPELLTPVG